MDTGGDVMQFAAASKAVRRPKSLLLALTRVELGPLVSESPEVGGLTWSV